MNSLEKHFAYDKAWQKYIKSKKRELDHNIFIKECDRIKDN